MKHLIFKNKRLGNFVRRQGIRFLVRPYVRWRNIPIIAITGTNGKTTVTRLLNRIYLRAGYNVGRCDTGGAYHNDTTVIEGDRAGGTGIWHATRGREVDVMVAETGRGGILRSGLGFFKCHTGVVTNVYEDHLGLEGVDTVEQMAEVKSTIPRHTDPDGVVVLNGDHHLVKSMATRTRASVIYFTMEERQDQFDRCYYLKGDRIFRKFGTLTEAILDIKAIPITLRGVLTYNIENVMAVLAAVEGMQPWVPVPAATVKSALQEFGKDANDNPGRFTMFRLDGNTVLLCRCKNPEGYRQNVEVIRRIKKKYGFDCVIGILTGIGDRRQDHFEKISRTVAPVCRYFFIRPPKKKYLRSRTGEEIVRLLSLNIPKDRILRTDNLALESIVDLTERVVKGQCLYVYFEPIQEADIDIPKIICEGQVLPIEIGD